MVAGLLVTIKDLLLQIISSEDYWQSEYKQNLMLGKKQKQTEIFFSFSPENRFVCLFVLRFYGPVNPMGSCRARSVYLTTHLLGRKNQENRFRHFMQTAL